jgi:hypothetical protein
LTDAGTSATTAELALPPEDDAADVDVEVDAGADAEDELELADELLLLLLPHAAIATAQQSGSAASSGFLQVLIRLLLVETTNPGKRRIRIGENGEVV